MEGPGILRQRNVGRQRYRVFEAAEVVELFTGLERVLASPSGDTATAAPTRRCPLSRQAPPTTPDRRGQSSPPCHYSSASCGRLNDMAIVRIHPCL